MDRAGHRLPGQPPAVPVQLQSAQAPIGRILEPCRGVIIIFFLIFISFNWNADVKRNIDQIASVSQPKEPVDEVLRYNGGTEHEGVLSTLTFVS